MTYLEMTNEVLERLREDAVAAVTDDDYSKLIGNFINKAKEKVERTWDWQRLRTTIQVTTVAGTFSYALTGAGKRYRILYDNATNMPDVFNDTEDMFLHAAQSARWMSARLNENNQQNGQPMYFDVNGYDVNHDPIINFYPIPDGVERVINVSMYIPQTKLTLDADILVCPDRPVLEYAYLYALSERGEDNGTFYQEQREDAKESLGDEVAREASFYPETLQWSAD